VATPVAVFGEDDRVALPQSLRSVQERVGLLVNQRARSACTAFCVAPDVIATAAHCIHGTAGEQPPRIADFVFTPNAEQRRAPSRIAGAAAGRAEQFVLSGATTLSVRPPIDATKDWALVRLEQPVCRRGVLPVRPLPTEQILAEAAQGKVYQVAYHRDFQPWRLAYSKPCAVQRSFEGSDWSVIANDFSDAANLLLHQCDTGGASSGSPLLRAGPDGPEVIGISIGTYEESKVEIEGGRVVKRGRSVRVANTGLNALVFAAKLDLFRNAAIVTAPQQIRVLQLALKQRNHYAGAVNGQFSSELRLAIEAYERSQGLIVTGLATQALLKRLQGPAAGVRLPPQAG
jgi:protease YdgD